MRSQKLSPCIDQTAADIRAYYVHAVVGDVAVIRHTQGDMLRYDVTKVAGQNPRIGRVYLEQGGSFYTKHGRNCFHPKGQSSLVVPTSAVLEWVSKNPRGQFGIETIRSGGLGE